MRCSFERHHQTCAQLSLLHFHQETKRASSEDTDGAASKPALKRKPVQADKEKTSAVLRAEIGRLNAEVARLSQDKRDYKQWKQSAAAGTVRF